MSVSAADSNSGVSADRLTAMMLIAFGPGKRLTSAAMSCAPKLSLTTRMTGVPGAGVVQVTEAWVSVGVNEGVVPGTGELSDEPTSAIASAAI